MKKIRFGSFPMIKMKQKERKCFDTYLIKSFADKIAISSTLGTISRTERAFITPDLIRKHFKTAHNSGFNESEYLLDYDLIEESKKNKTPAAPAAPASVETKPYKKTFELSNEQQRIKRAFIALKNLNKNIIENPFYRDNINYPIYIENNNKDGRPTDYDFLLLTNDLLNKSSIDEINYNDNITMIVLFLKIILSPHLRLVDINTTAGNDAQLLKNEVAKIIEYSQQNGTNPIALMFNLLVSAAQVKKDPRSINSGYQGVINFTKNAVQSAFGVSEKQQTRKFFDDNYPHTKTISQLLHTIKFEDIHAFFDDNSDRLDIKREHTGYVQNSVNETGMWADPTFRSYMVQKTEQYNSVLSFLNALYDFNDDNLIYTDVNIMDNIQLEGDLSISNDQVIEFMDTTAMPCFMINLKNRINILMNIQKSKLETVLNAKINDKAKKTDNDFGIAELKKELAAATTDNERESHRAALNAAYYRQTVTGLLLGQFDTNKPKDKVINLDFNLEALQFDLTQLYSVILMGLLTPGTPDAPKPSYIGTLIDPSTLIQKDNISQQFGLTPYTKSLTDNINKAIKEQINIYILQNLNNIKEMLIASNNPDAKLLNEELAKMLDKFEGSLNTTGFSIFELKEVDTLLNDCIFSKTKEYFSNNSVQNLKKIKENIQERNPIIKKLNNPLDRKKFKSFIFTKALLIDLYKLVYFYDTQRYISGIINTVPSTKINNEDNQLKYILKRLGLESNVIYIIDAPKNRIILQMPDFLSLTGTALYESISMLEMEQICRINWNGMWKDPSFSFPETNASAEAAELKKNIKSHEKAIEELTKKIDRNTDPREKQKLENQKENFEKKKMEAEKKLVEANQKAKSAGTENLNNHSIDPNYDTYNVFRETTPEDQYNYEHDLNRGSPRSGHGYQTNINTNGGYQPNNGYRQNGFTTTQNQLPQNDNYNQNIGAPRQPEQPGPSSQPILPDPNNLRQPNPYMNPYQMQASRYNQNQNQINQNIPDPRRFGI